MNCQEVKSTYRIKHNDNIGYLSEQGHVAVIAGVNVLVKLGIEEALQRVDDV